MKPLISKRENLDLTGLSKVLSHDRVQQFSADFSSEILELENRAHFSLEASASVQWELQIKEL